MVLTAAVKLVALSGQSLVGKKAVSLDRWMDMMMGVKMVDYLVDPMGSEKAAKTAESLVAL